MSAIGSNSTTPNGNSSLLTGEESFRSRGLRTEGLTALELLSIEQDLDHVVTFSAGIDGMLGGGVPVGKITEFCGSPGIGKTQMRCLK